MQLILVFTFIDYSPSYYGDYAYPVWADVLGWSISFSCILAVPIRGIILVSGKSGPLWAVRNDRLSCSVMTGHFITPTKLCFITLVKRNFITLMKRNFICLKKCHF